MFLYLSVIFVIIFGVFFLFYIMAFQNLISKEKLSPFECGFDPFSLSRVPFSLKFFFIAIVFLVFDIEIIIILPFPVLLTFKNFSLVVSFLGINLIIIVGLFYEWKSGMIEWIK
uniref:NADH-ubiquinone oxidoreductase chain 3 n=1 Tax=Amblyomma ovale TaxID=208206 RepID=A0A7D5GAL2_9ACAR|nr:NADH dehydrogenase subunit 3 [Amblyomma ovale]QLF99610.1 NADH dehydrogenase subunit 3 [Amblyomma ovale]QLF99623.1 NADH dehydrogenase subunit 3 [Amblyomma ovale]